MNEDALYLIWLSGRYKSFPGEKKKLLELYGSAKNIYEAPLPDLAQSIGECAGGSRLLFEELSGKSLDAASRDIENVMNFGGNVITVTDKEYPKTLKNIPDAPLVLFVKGDISILKKRMIAVVGTRSASPYGRWAAFEIAKRIASCGVAVVSGMARGIDTRAHLGALAAGGDTVAIFGTGIDLCFPDSNLKLCEEIKEKGLIVSEYGPKTPGRPCNFPARNRIISGLSESVVVVEGGKKSGALITASFAARDGRDVFAVPGSIDRPGSSGPNCLIRDGAMPITDLNLTEEVLHIGKLKKTKLPPMSGDEKKVCSAVRNASGAGPDELFLMLGEKLNLPAILSALELKGIIHSENGRYYIGCE